MHVKPKKLRIPKPRRSTVGEVGPTIQSSKEVSRSNGNCAFSVIPSIDIGLGVEGEVQSSLGLRSALHKNLRHSMYEGANLTPLSHLTFNVNSRNLKESWGTRDPQTFSIEVVGTILQQQTANTQAEVQPENGPPAEEGSLRNLQLKFDRRPCLPQSDTLAKLLYNIFTEGPLLEECRELSLLELQILNAILYKKFYKCLNPTELQSPRDSLTAKFRSIVSFRTAKRPEECYKFVLFKAFKHLKSQFRTQFKVKRVQLEKFYNFYFGDVAKGEKLALDAFFFPSKSKKKQSKNLLNHRYFSLVFKSRRFICEILDFVQNNLVEAHFEDAPKKIGQFMKKLKTYLGSDSQTNWPDPSQLAGKLFDSKQLKLPWTMAEVQEAAFRVTELVDSFKFDK